MCSAGSGEKYKTLALVCEPHSLPQVSIVAPGFICPHRCFRRSDGAMNHGLHVKLNHELTLVSSRPLWSPYRLRKQRSERSDRPCPSGFRGASKSTLREGQIRTELRAACEGPRALLFLDPPNPSTENSMAMGGGFLYNEQAISRPFSSFGCTHFSWKQGDSGQAI